MKITGHQTFIYSLLALPLAFAGLPIYLHAPDFYARNLNLSLTTIGFTLLMLRLVDAIQDPIIGVASDYLHSYRKVVMSIGLLMLGGGFWMVFHPIASHPIGWFALSIFVCTTGFSIVSINFQALGGLWHTDAVGRTRITSWREAFGLVGLLAASIAPTLLGSRADTISAFHWLAVLYVPLLLISALAFFNWMALVPLDKPGKLIDMSDIRHWLNTPWKRQFFGIYLLNSIASAIPAVLVLFFISDRLGAAEDTGIFLMAYFLSGALSMFFWQRFSERFGKAHSWMYAIVLAVATFIWASLLAKGDSDMYLVICVLSGFALGADLALPPSMLADYIAEQQDQHKASMYFSIMTFLSKASLAIATGLTLPLLGIMGYQAGQVHDYAVTNYLSIAYAVLPCILKAVTLMWLWRARLVIIKEGRL